MTVSLAQVRLELLDATAPADGGGMRDPLAQRTFVDEPQRILAHVEEVADAPRLHVARIHEDRVLGDEVQSLEQPVQRERGLTRTTGTEQEYAAAAGSEARAVQRQQVHATR